MARRTQTQQPTKPQAAEAAQATQEAQASQAAQAAEPQAVTLPDDVLALADHYFAGQMVKRAVTMAEELSTRLREALAERETAGPDKNLTIVQNALDRACNKASTAILELKAGSRGASYGDLKTLIGNVSRWSQKNDGSTSAVADFADVVSDYVKARRAHHNDEPAKLAKIAAPYATAVIDRTALDRLCVAIRAAGQIEP